MAIDDSLNRWLWAIRINSDIPYRDECGDVCMFSGDERLCDTRPDVELPDIDFALDEPHWALMILAERLPTRAQERLATGDYDAEFRELIAAHKEKAPA